MKVGTSARSVDKTPIMKNNEASEYYVSHFNGLHGSSGPSGPLYWKVIDDLKKIQSAVSEWQLEENSTKSESDSSLSRSEVIKKLAKIEAGVSHWEMMAEEIEDVPSEEEWHIRQVELEALESNIERAGRGMFHAQAILATNQDVLWAVLFLLYVHRKNYAVQLLQECLDPVTAIPPLLRDFFARFGLPDEKAVREAMKQETPPTVSRLDPPPIPRSPRASLTGYLR